MIDDSTINEALDYAWKGDRMSTWESMENNLEKARMRFYDKMAKSIPDKDSRKVPDLDDIACRIWETDSALIVKKTQDGLIVDTPGDSFGIRIYGGWQVSVHSRNRHTGWDATMWEIEDIAKAIAAMGDFDALSASRKEEFRRRVEEIKRRSAIVSKFHSSAWELEKSLYSALENGEPIEEFRDIYLPMRKGCYDELGDQYDNATLESDWKGFLESVGQRLSADRKEAARAEARRIRQEAKERAMEVCSSGLSQALGRDCWIERRSPSSGIKHWDEYLVELADGRVVWFKDFSRELGSINQAILAIVPILEELASFASTKFSLRKSSSPQLEYTIANRSFFRKELLQMAGDDEVIQYLSDKMKVLKSPVILWPSKRTVKLFCFYPRKTRSALSFTLRKLDGKEDVDHLVDAVKRFYAALKKHPCHLG